MEQPKNSKPFYKNRFVVIIFIILGLALLGSLVDGDHHKPALRTSPTDNSAIIVKPSDKEKSVDLSDDGNYQALLVIRKEKKVVEAIITESNVLYVSVKDDGTRRDGFAQYLCQILKEKHAKADWVKITRVGSTNDPKRDNAYGVLLGQAHCN